MRMGSYHRACPAVQVPREACFFGGDLGVDVYKNHFRVSFKLGELLIGDSKRVIRHWHINPTHDLQNTHWNPRAALEKSRTVTRHSRRIVGRPQNSGVIDDVAYFPAVKSMV